MTEEWVICRLILLLMPLGMVSRQRVGLGGLCDVMSEFAKIQGLGLNRKTQES